MDVESIMRHTAKNFPTADATGKFRYDSTSASKELIRRRMERFASKCL